MPALHVVGEILGATGLTHERALSLSRVLDLLSLDASSTRSFFCRWRFLLEGASDGIGVADDSDGYGGNGKQSNGDAWSATWEVLHGDPHGQTQVHCPAASLTVPLAYSTPSTSNKAVDASESQAPLLLDVAWSHPIDVHLASSPGFRGWPHLALEVWSLDALSQTQLCGVAQVCIPCTSAEYILDAPLAHAVPSSWLEWMAESLSLAEPERRDSSIECPSSPASPISSHRMLNKHVEPGSVLEPSGTVYLRIAVLCSGI